MQKLLDDAANADDGTEYWRVFVVNTAMAEHLEPAGDEPDAHWIPVVIQIKKC